jgi:CHASE2 domain-containing sensor protein
MSDGRESLVSLKQGGTVLAVVYAIIVTLLFHAVARDFPLALRFEHQLADWRTGLLSDQAQSQHPRIAVVLVDDRTLKGLPYTSPVDRGVLARLIERLDAAGAAAVAMDFVFQRPTEPDKDKRLIAAIRDARTALILAAGDERTAGLSEEEVAHQRDFITATEREVGYANLDEDRDDVVRHRVGNNPGGAFPISFAARIAAVDGKLDADPAGRMAWLRRPTNNADTFFTVNGALVLDDGPVGQAVRERLKGRLVIVGGGFPDRDRHRTPLFGGDGEGGGSTVHGVFLHAHAVAQIIDGRYIFEMPEWPVVLFLSAAGFMLGLHFEDRGFKWIPGTVSTGLLIAIDLLIFWQMRWVVPYVPAAAAWLLGGFGGFFTARLAQRWETRRWEARR